MKEANNLFGVKIKMEFSITWEIGHLAQNVGDFSQQK